MAKRHGMDVKWRNMMTETGIEASRADNPEALDDMVCPQCKSSNVVRAGDRINKGERKKRYLCNGCGRKFTLDDGLRGFRYKIEHIRSAICFYLLEASLSQIKEDLRHVHGIDVSTRTISNWIKRFSNRPEMRPPGFDIDSESGIAGNSPEEHSDKIPLEESFFTAKRASRHQGTADAPTPRPVSEAEYQEIKYEQKGNPNLAEPAQVVTTGVTKAQPGTRSTNSIPPAIAAPDDDAPVSPAERLNLADDAMNPSNPRLAKFETRDIACVIG